MLFSFFSFLPMWARVWHNFLYDINYQRTLLHILSEAWQSVTNISPFSRSLAKSLADRFSRTTSNHDLRACARARERERRLLEILNIWHYRSILPLKSFSLDLEWVVQKFLVKIKFRREQVLDKMKMDILSFLGEKRLMSRTDQY